MKYYPWSRLWLLNVTLSLLILSPFILASDLTENVIKTDSQSPLAPGERQVFVSTLNGELLAMNPRTGHIKWMLKEEPVLRVPVTVQHGYTFLPDPQDGSLYLLIEGRLKKMPFTIPQLVQASPCKSSDGVLYAGSKKDIWFAINPTTGNKVETLSEATAERVCPASNEKAVFIGRTEYQISMFDAQSRSKRYNATFTDYSSHVLPEDVTYPLQHFSSSSDGRIITVDGSTGRILWDRDFGNPIVAMYLLQGDGLHRLPFTVIGRETLDSLVEVSTLLLFLFNNLSAT
uniref:Pyrrolo-quinoline quinone repeat domain-containing protein n=1 Tax=Plectus sambesii TaxID=2011161 RepID=A0A914VVH6_9BILA